MKRLVTICAVAGLVIAVSGMTQAATINVPADYPTIQDAVDVAIDGDKIYITGVHTEQVTIIGKDISLIGVTDAAVIAPAIMFANIDPVGFHNS